MRALAVQGGFDDCQALAKGCFQDPGLSRDLGLTSANSINLARLLAQLLYYFEAVAQLRIQEMRDPPVIAVPSGNFGNLCAGLMAQQMGLPVKAFVAATNANRTVPDYLDTGRYQGRPSVPTLSNAMDVGDPSNWPRIQHLFRGDRFALRNALRWGSLTDKETRAALWELHGQGYLADPHAAVAYGVLRRNLGLSEPAIFLGTAHPAKFREVLEGPMGVEIGLPPSLQEVAQRPLQKEVVPNDLEALKARLRGLYPRAPTSVPSPPHAWAIFEVVQGGFWKRVSVGVPSAPKLKVQRFGAPMRPLLLPLAALIAAAPAQVQSLTHLNVPAKQMVSIRFEKAPGDTVGQWSGFTLFRPDKSVAAYNSIPAGQALVIRELSLSTLYPPQSGPFQVDLTLYTTDPSCPGCTWTTWATSFTAPAAGRFSITTALDTGMSFANPTRPKVGINLPNPPSLDFSILDKVDRIYGFGYLIAY